MQVCHPAAFLIRARMLPGHFCYLLNSFSSIPKAWALTLVLSDLSTKREILAGHGCIKPSCVQRERISVLAWVYSVIESSSLCL